jgi:AcrR family transcriptional regulator
VSTRLFASRGFDATTVREIAKAADLSVAGMFHYFSCKEAILNGIIEETLQKVYDKFENICTSDKDPLRKLRDICEFYVEHYAGHRDKQVILNFEGKSLSPADRRLFVYRQRRYVANLKKLLKELAQRGALKPIDPSIIAFIFFGMVHWICKWYNPRGRVGPKKLGEIFSEVFLRGITKTK